MNAPTNHNNPQPSSLSREAIRAIVRGVYDLQKMRIETGNRLVAAFKAKLGIVPGQKEEDAEKEAVDMLAQIKLSFDSITEGVLSIPTMKSFQKKLEKLKEPTLISSYAELTLSAQYFQLLRDEQEQFKRLGDLVSEVPIWIHFLQGVRGVGPAMAGVILSEIDIHKAEYPSSLWAYAGLDVVQVTDEATGEIKGEGRSRRAAHLIDLEYIDKDGNTATRKSITYNPWLKTKLMGVLGTLFVKQPADKSPYRKAYDDYKFRLENHPKWADRSKGHRHQAAIRYAIKRFLVDLYRAWRELEGLPVAPEYSEAKLGMVHGSAGKYAG